MTIEKIAALLWRFIGLVTLVTALPGVVVVVGGLVWSIGNGAYFLQAPMLWPALLVSVQVIVGVVVLRFSGTLGRIVARGL